MHQLCGGHLPTCSRVIELRGLLCWQLLGGGREQLFGLLCWHVRCDKPKLRLHELLDWHVLCLERFAVLALLGGGLLSGKCGRLLKLRGWFVPGVGWSEHLPQLCRGPLLGCGRLLLSGVPRRQLPVRDGGYELLWLRRGHVLGLWCVGVYEL